MRAGSFATNALGWAESIQTDGVIREPYGAAAKAPIHERDIGPESLTLAEQVDVLGNVLGEPVRFEEIPVPQARTEMLVAGWPAEAVDGLLAAYAEMAAGPAPVTDEVERITGRSARTFREWVADHRADFQADVRAVRGR